MKNEYMKWWQLTIIFRFVDVWIYYLLSGIIILIYCRLFATELLVMSTKGQDTGQQMLGMSHVHCIHTHCWCIVEKGVNTWKCAFVRLNGFQWMEEKVSLYLVYLIRYGSGFDAPPYINTYNVHSFHSFYPCGNDRVGPSLHNDT